MEKIYTVVGENCVDFEKYPFAHYSFKTLEAAQRELQQEKEDAIHEWKMNEWANQTEEDDWHFSIWKPYEYPNRHTTIRIVETKLIG